MATHYENVQRWFDIQLFGSKKKYYSSHSSSLWGDEYSLYSYGRHFPLVVILRDRKNKPTLILINGNMYSTTTSRHQWVVRNYVRNLASNGKTDVPDVIIPFDALDSAGVVKNSIKLVAATEDTWTETKKYSYEKPDRLRTRTTVVEGEWTYDEKGGSHYEKYSQPEVHIFHYIGWWAVERSDDPDSPTGVRWDWLERRHWLGESLIKCTYRYRSSRGAKDESWWKERKGVYFLSGFDHNEPTPSYFFAQLPRKAKPTTVAEAYECLKPESVKAAEMLGNKVRRQGDIFAIELDTLLTKELTKQGATYERMGSLLDTNHVATDVARLPDGTLLARGTLWHRPRLRRPDHRRVKLGKKWHVIAKNTVPIVGGR